MKHIRNPHGVVHAVDDSDADNLATRPGWEIVDDPDKGADAPPVRRKATKEK